MKGIVVGHGWRFDSTVMLKVPTDVFINFYTDENAPLIIGNSLALLSRGDLGIPLDTKSPGEDVANYECESFTDAQIGWVLALNRTEAMPLYFVGSAGIASPGAFCTSPDTCPEDGPHECDGILGLVAREKITELDVLNCRINVNSPAPATEALIGESGDRDTSLQDEFKEWVYAFIGMGLAEKDAAWRELPYATQVYLVSDDEMGEWSECYEARMQLASTNDPDRVQEILDQLRDKVRTRLLRDYPEMRQRLASTVGLSPEEREWIEQTFLQLDFDLQVAVRRDQLSELAQARFMAHDGFAAWAQAYNTYDLYKLNLSAPNLAALIGRLPPSAKAILAQQADLAYFLSGYPGVFA
jgi:hypothetical protein